MAHTFGSFGIPFSSYEREKFYSLVSSIHTRV